LIYLELEKLDIKEARIERVNHSQLDSLKREIRIAAIKDAKTKADYLLSSIGEKTGNALVVTDNPTTALYQGNDYEQRPFRGNVFEMRDMQMMDKDSYNDKLSSFQSDTIEFRKIKLHSYVYIKFAIRQ